MKIPGLSRRTGSRHAGAVTFCIVLLGAALLAGSAHARDNFLIFLADDLGVDVVGVYSDDVVYGHDGEGATPGPTPRIDQLAAEGVLFRNAYTNSQCAPTRAQLLTGRHALRTGIGTPGGADLDLAETTLPEMLAATHENAVIGKWHLGPGGDNDHPIDSGFDYFAGSLSSGVADYFDWEKVVNSSGSPAVVTSNHMVYATDDASAEVIAKISEFGDDPWLIYVAFNAPHAPFHVPTDPLTTTVNAGSNNRTKYEAAVEAMDREIGDILDSIPASVLADTTVIFMGDNGTPSGVTRTPFLSNHAKASLYDGGINVPLIITGPHAAVGRESLALVQSVDLFATIAEIAGVDATAADSISLLPHLADPDLPTDPLRPYAYAELFSPNGVGVVYNEHERALRTDRYKLIWRDGVFEEFFDMDDSPFEEDNLLPYEGMTEEQQAAYDAMVQHMEAVETAGEIVCPNAPEPTCTAGYAKGSFDWRRVDGGSDRVKLTLKNGPALDQTSFGDPVTTDGTGYSMCVYDEADALVGQMRLLRAGDFCSGKECWKALGGDSPTGKGYRFKDKLAASNGFFKVQMVGGDDGKSKLKILGTGDALPDGVTASLEGSAAATLEVYGSDMPACLSVSLTDVSTAEVDRFKARL